MKKILSALFLASVAQGHAAVYISNFTGNPGDPASSVDGWVQSEADNDPASPKSFVADVTVDQLPGLAMGAFYDVPNGSTLSLTKSGLNIQQVNPTTLSAQFKAVFALTDSSTSYPYRDVFSLTLRDSSNVSIASVVFTPESQTFPPVDPEDDRWNVSINGGPDVAGVFAGGDYNLAVIFDNFGNFTVRIADYATDTDVYQSGNLTPGSTNNIASLEFGYAQGSGGDFGDNIFGIANVSVVPEPSSVLLVGLSALGLLRRKRAQA